MNSPVSYIQGPPGTGKTSTIVNTILTAFFNNKTVLFTSYNNKPIIGVEGKLSKITYKNRRPLFPYIIFVSLCIFIKRKGMTLSMKI